MNVTVGEVSFKTYLVFGKELSQKEQDAIIKGCMLDCELTSDKIREGNELIEKVKTQTGFDPRIIAKIVWNALLGLYPDAVGNTVAIEQGFYEVAEGTTSETEMRADFVIGNTASTLIGMGMGGVAGYAVKVLAASAKDIAKEAIRLLKEREDARNALEYEVLFTRFYEECNDKIIAAMTGERGWHITGKSKLPKEITAFGSPVTQTWYLDMDLEKTTSGANPLDWTGSYEGYIHLNIEHDTRTMDQEFPEEAFKEIDLEAAREELEALGIDPDAFLPSF